MQVGDEIDVITKGPIGLTDEIAFIAAGAAPIPRLVGASVWRCKRYRKHPKWAFRDPRTHALEPVYSVHYNDYAAKLQGAQIAYDVGIQRTCWQIHSLTNWMGDAGRAQGAAPASTARTSTCPTWSASAAGSTPRRSTPTATTSCS